MLEYFLVLFDGYMTNIVLTPQRPQSHIWDTNFEAGCELKQEQRSDFFSSIEKWTSPLVILKWQIVWVDKEYRGSYTTNMTFQRPCWGAKNGRDMAHFEGYF